MKLLEAAAERVGEIPGGEIGSAGEPRDVVSVLIQRVGVETEGSKVGIDAVDGTREEVDSLGAAVVPLAAG